MDNNFSNQIENDKLFEQFNGENIKISIDKTIFHFLNLPDLLKKLDKYKIQYTYLNTQYDWGNCNYKQLDISFGRETNFQNLYILVSLLKEFDIRSVFYSEYFNNEVTIGVYFPPDSDIFSSICGPGEKSISANEMLKLSFTTSTNDFLNVHFNIENKNMDKIIEDYLREKYVISNPNNCTEEESNRVFEICCNDKYIEHINRIEQFVNLETIKLSNNKIKNFDMSYFPKLKELDCSFNPIKNLILWHNPLLEYIRYEGIRGKTLKQLNLSNNTKLKKIIGGQDGFTQIDLNNNTDIEEIDIRLSQSLKHIDVSKCLKLKKIRLWGVLIPYVDLTNNNNLNYVEIHYLNEFSGKSGVYGRGFPRPIIFVNDKFNIESMDKIYRAESYYTHVLVVVKKNSEEEKVLKKLNNNELSFSQDISLVDFHYKLMSLLEK